MEQDKVLVTSHGTVLTFDEELDEFVCLHPEAYIEKACCSPFQVGDSGYVECGCGGRDSVVCPAVDCTGIQDWEIDTLFDNLI